MPLSTFDGEPTIHKHYDADGNLTGTTEIPGWSADDRAWALGLTLHEANRCSGCGGDLHETTDPGYQWKPELPTVCHRCVGIQAAADKYKDHPQRRAMLYAVTKVKKPSRRKRRG